MVTLINRWLASITRGPGSLPKLLPIAVPMVISQLFDTTMTFIDRLFLSYVSPLAMAACMAGGLTAFLCGNIIFGLVSYCATLVAHRYGAAKQKECPVVVMQAVWLALVSYPFILLAGHGVSKLFYRVGHTPQQVALELSYFRIMIFAAILGLLRAAFCGFFAGIGKTRIIMFGNAAAMATNIVCNYILIFGKLGFPRLGIVGAALGTALASGVMTLIMATAFFLHVRRPPFNGLRLLQFEPAILRQLVRYGLPSGFEGFCGLFAFAIILMMLHGISESVAAAVTMVYNWELFSFFPMLGLQIAVSTLVGQNMGAHNIGGARQTVRAGLTLGFAYTTVLAFFFMCIPRLLLTPFMQKATPEIIGMAIPMMRLMAIYLTIDSATLILSGALRGAGDTLWVMILTQVFHIILIMSCAVTIYWLKAGPVTVWASLCVAVLSGAFLFGARYRQGHWQKHDLSTVQGASPC